MMGPDYTHWHGTYEVAKNFYGQYIPELQQLVARYQESSDPAKKAAVEKLAKLLDQTLNNTNHQWYLNKMTPAEKAQRQKERDEFQKRYAQ